MEYLTTHQTAKALGITYRHLFRMIKAGIVPTVRLGHAHLILKANIPGIKARWNRQVGRPAKDRGV